VRSYNYPEHIIHSFIRDVGCQTFFTVAHIHPSTSRNIHLYGLLLRAAHRKWMGKEEKSKKHLHLLDQLLTRVTGVCLTLSVSACTVSHTKQLETLPKSLLFLFAPIFCCISWFCIFIECSFCREMILLTLKQSQKILWLVCLLMLCAAGACFFGFFITYISAIVALIFIPIGVVGGMTKNPTALKAFIIVSSFMTVTHFLAFWLVEWLKCGCYHSMESNAALCPNDFDNTLIFSSLLLLVQFTFDVCISPF
jgi:hypothetical protein